MNPYDMRALEAVWSTLRHRPGTGGQRVPATGVDGMCCAAFERNLQGNLAEIARTIARKDSDGLPCYRFAPLLQFEVAKSVAGVRRIHIPRIRDQLVIRAMHDQISRAARSCGMPTRPAAPTDAVGRFRERLAAFDNPFVVRTDIQSFYDSLVRSSAVACALDIVECATTRHLLEKWSAEVRVRAPWMSGKSGDRLVDGLPQGVSLSSILSELAMANFDREASSRFPYQRYVDDIVVVCTSESEARGALEWIEQMAARLRLKLSPAKTSIRRLELGVAWLGLEHRTAGIRLAPGRVDRWIRRFARIKKKAARAIAATPEAAEKAAIANRFQREIRDEIRGRGSSRSVWFALADDDGQWREVDRSLHAMIRSLHRLALLPPPKGRQLPSVHRALLSKKARLSLSVPSNADQGQRATRSACGASNANQGQIACDGTETFSHEEHFPPH